MDSENENKKDEIPTIAIDEAISVDLYLLWRSSEHQKFTIQALFSPEAKFTFDLVTRLSDGTYQDQNPCIYRLHLNLIRNADGKLTIKHKNTIYPAQQYQLRISQKGYISTSHFEENFMREINNIDISHHFLFDIKFPTSAPGGRVTTWKSLCLFAYHLIDNRQFNIFESFIEQFALVMHTDSIQISNSEFINFVKTTYGYFSNKERILDNPSGVIDIVRIIGCLPLEKNNFKVTDDHARKLSSLILMKLSQQLMPIFETMNETKWLLFKDGLVILMSIEILDDENMNTDYDTISLLNQIPTDDNKRQSISSDLFKMLIQLGLPIMRTNWIELFSFVDDEELNLTCLSLAATFDHILYCFKRIVPLYTIDDNFKREINKMFENKLKNNITLNLHVIVEILQYLEQQPSTTTSDTEHIRLIQSIIESSEELGKQIKRYLKNLNVQITDLELLCDLFRNYNPYLLSNIDKTTYLIDTLHNQEARSYDFYTCWFEYFLCDKNYVQTEYESQQFQQLLKEWTNKFRHDRYLLEKISMKMDTLIDKLAAVTKAKSNDRRINYFINYIIDIYFQQNSIFDVIAKIGLYIQNPMILDAFVDKFFTDYIGNNRNILKMMTNYNNPLNRLMELSQRQTQMSNDLLLRLLTQCSKAIKPDDDELLRHSFIDPARDTCTYAILFNDCFAKFPIRLETLDRLKTIWSKWEGQQLRYEQIWTKKHYNPDQKYCFDKIWEAVGKHSGKLYQVGVLFETAHKDIMEKTRIKEKITTFLNDYCDQANDKQDYMDHLDFMQHQMERSMISEIRVPPQLETLVPSVDRLAQFSHSNAWLNYYVNHVHEQGKKPKDAQRRQEIINPIGIDDNQDDHWNNVYGENDTDDNLEFNLPPNQVPDVDNTAAVTTMGAVPLQANTDHTCMDILAQAINILDQFQQEVQMVCIQWSTAPIKQLLNLFPDIQSAETDIHNLKSLIQPDIFPNLMSILVFWKERSHIQHICHGIKNLLAHLRLPQDQNSNVVINTLDDLLTINEQTLGELCFDYYERYVTIVTKNYSAQILDLWSHYYLSHDVIGFLHARTAAEMNNLLEVVNDWDDTLISTRTVMDFAKLKAFFDQVYAMIRETQRQENLSTLDHIAICFENICKAKEFQYIVDLFPTCSTSLLAIQRLYLELTNKEKSKRQRIIDVMQRSSIVFEQNISKKHQFNVRLTPQNLTFADLGELRDRARLIEYSDGNNIKQETELEKEQLQQFIILVNTIETILTTLSSLFIAGYPMVTNFSVTGKFACIDGQFNELQQLCIDLKRNLDVWERDLCHIYEQYPELTHFFCEQFNAIESAIYNNDNTSNGFHLLKYIGFEPEQLHQRLIAPELNDLDPIAHLQEIGRHLAMQRVDSKVNILGKKVYLIETTEDGILRGLFSLFQLTKNPVRVHQLFYCTERTNWPEIRAFVYRCFFSQTLQILIRPHLLSPDIQDRIVPLLRGFIERHPANSFYLGLLSTSAAQNIQLINTLKMLNIVTTLRDQDLLNNTDFGNQLEIMLRHCTLVTSRLAGLGKTSLIHEQCRLLGKPVIKFPIGGDVQADKIAERLAHHTKDLTTCALHIDIGPVDNIRTLDEILYCLTLFHSFRFGQSAISLPSDIPIFIELDSSPLAINQKHLTICQHLQLSHHLEHIQWNELHYDRLKIQFVANYLDAINTGTIIKSDINETNTRIIDAINCLKLIQTQFSFGKNLGFITWTQLNIFIDVFYSLFNGFSKCGYFLVDCIANPQLRLDILQAFLHSSDQFTSLCVEKVRNQQRATTEIQENIQQQPELLNDTVIRWETTQPFTVVFSATNDPLFVYKTVKDVPPSLIDSFRAFQQALTPGLPQNAAAALLPTTTMAPIGAGAFSESTMFVDHSQLSHVQFFLKLASLSHKFFNKAVCNKCFKQFPYDTIHCGYCALENTLLRPKTFDDNDIIIFQSCIATSLEAQYVLTPDNYIKMLLVFLRVQSGLPVLIMGETGCGKTALINFLCKIILDDELEIFPMHAGINGEKILERMSHIIAKAEECERDGKRLWVFFDEFNTTHSIGIIKEITCERTLLGKPLPENMVFLGACNPRRYKPDQLLFDNNIGIKKDRYDVQQVHSAMGGAQLLHTVVALPETMLEYVWDYGFLDGNTEKKYIAAKLKTCVHLSAHAGWLKALVILISKSHAFIRKIEDASSVSLRDVARYCRLFNWFYASVIERTNNDNQPAVALRRASITTLLLCYYYRLKSLEHKRAYIDMVETILLETSRDPRGQRGFVIRWLNDEEMDIVNRMELPSGTAKNRALLENIFVLLACIVNRIPLIICGKPGCSKTSAVQIVISNLKGKKSHNSFLQTLPEVIAVSYQGSQNCTSESIEKVFERANKYLTAQKDSSLLPVIVFDEIGLAELSPHNPLKVLHAELEVETCKYGFVGISNWRLDASKMNRALYLACPDPDNEDLKLTGTIIAQSMLGELEAARLSKEILPGLAVAYYELFPLLKMKQKYEYYFGLRDFYSLIKGVVREIQNNPNIDPYKVIRRQLTINFDGVVDGANFMWECFCATLKREELLPQYPPPNLKQLLDQNLSVRSGGRYLMLIAENDSAIDYVERYIQTIPRRRTQTVHTLVGSQMPGDLVSNHTYTEAYSYRVLMDIILYAETSVTLVMRHLGHLYDNLYDLFNQNFAVSAHKKYCRIALGALYHPRCLVNEDFYCIVFVNQEDVDKCDPPFLNRFEKHLITIQDLIQPQHWEMVHHVLNWITDFLSERQGDRFPLLPHLFIGYNKHHICSLVIDTWEELNRQQQAYNEKNVIDLCKEKLLRIASFDLVLTLAVKSNKLEDDEELIQQYYNIHAFASFDNIILRGAPKQIIYTYTQIYDNILYDTNTIDEIKLGNFKMELEFVTRIKAHYKSDDAKRLLLIRVDYRTEHKQLLSIKHILLNAFNEHTQPHERYIWLIIHVERNMLHEATNDVLFDNWSIDMVDDLNNHQMIHQDAVKNPSYLQLVTSQHFDMSESIFIEMIERCLSKFHYNVINKQAEFGINKRRNMIINSLSIENNGFSLRRIIQEKLPVLMENIFHQNGSERFLDWRQDLLSDARTIATCRSFNDALQTTLIHFYDTYVFLLLAHLERHGLIDSYLYFMQTDDDQIKNMWIECLNSTLQKIDTTILNRDIVEVQTVLNIHLPCINAEYTVLKQIRKIIQQRQEIQMDDDDDEEDIDNLMLIQFQDKSIYKNQFINDSILNNENLFHHYLHDQLVFIINEHNIHLTADFVLQLISSNPSINNKFLLKYLLVDYEEFLQLLHIFEKGCQLIGEETIRLICTEQFIKIDDVNIKENELYYTLVLREDVFFQLPPSNTDITDEFIFKCSGDPFIENGIMNLIEHILSPAVINSITSVDDLTTTCSLICQGILELSNYSVDNLEKLRSFLSLIRCILSLTQNQSLTILKQVCTFGLELMFESCKSIHTFIERLLKTLETGEITADKETIQRTVIKLEAELLRNWLANNSDRYYEILQLINQKDNNLWRYSAKIFSYILQKLKLLESIQEHHGQIPQNEEYTQFEEYLQNLSDESNTVEQLLVDRIHMDLMLNISETNSDDKLQNEYNHFEENLQSMVVLVARAQQRPRLQSIGLLSWLKYYAHMYAFALSNNWHLEVMLTIDRLLTNDTSSFSTTLKLFILKQLVHMSNKTIKEICEIFLQRQVLWLHPLLNRIRQTNNEVREEIIIPIPLFDGHDEFLRVNAVLNEIENINEVRTLINDCGQNQPLMYSVYLWFIQHYCHFYSVGAETDERLLNTVQTDLQQALSTIFQPIGFKLIVSLCSNFVPNSYFHLLPTMSKVELNHRLIALNVTALCLSTRAQPQSTYLGTLFFNNQRQMPTTYVNHIQSVCLLGFAVSDPVATQMIDVRTRIQERLDTGQIQRQNSFMYQCSQECGWMFYFENCGRPASRSRCPLCKKDIGAEQYGVLIPRNPPQIQMTIDQGFQTITLYLDEFNRQVRLGYSNNTPADQSNSGEKSDHLNRTISFRFLHMLTHAQLLVLFELEYLSINDLQRSMRITNERHFQEHFEKDYDLLARTCTDPDQCYIWLYKLINHMMTPILIKPGLLDTQIKVVEMEQSIEQNIIFPHIISFTDEINQYRVVYTEFIRERDAQPRLTDYIDELRQNEQLYPLLSFFNMNKIITTNRFDEFILKMQNLPYSDKLYPITTFLLKRLNDYANIQHLYPIVEFINYLLHKYNYRIKRNDAAVKTIEECLNEARTDREIMRTYFDQFVHAWYELNLKEVQYKCQRPKIDRPVDRTNFASDTSLASLLLNTSKDASGILVAAYLHTLSNMQNEIIGFYNNMILNEMVNSSHIHVQAIKPEHVFRWNAAELNAKLDRDGFVINFEYGKGCDLIYDYEEIEITLRNLVSSLHLIDYENLHLFNYQFELYAENTSLITQIRQRIHQESITVNERVKLSKLLMNMNNDDIIHFVGSLDHMFTYLCNANVNEQYTTLHTFVEQHIVHQACLNENVFRRPPFSTILLTHIIAFYELIEEIAFDKVLRNFVKVELQDAKWPDDGTFDQFVAQTYGKIGIPEVLQSPAAWIGTLKRLLMRLLNANTVHLDIPLQYYLERIDMWSGDITAQHLESVEVNEIFLVQHTYIILCEFEVRNKPVPEIALPNIVRHAIPTNGEQRTNARQWITTAGNTSVKKTVISKPPAAKNDKKLRVR